MTTYVLPHFAGYLDVYIPAKNGGRSFFMHDDWFVMFSSIFIAVMLALTIVIAVMAYRNNRIASALTLFVVFLTGVCLATFVGNVCYQLWGVWPSILSVVALIVGMFTVEYPLILALADPHSRSARK